MQMLLIHIRGEQEMRDHEYKCVVEHSGLSESEIVRVDAVRDPITTDLLDGADILLVGGSGDYSLPAGEMPEMVESLKSIVVEARDRSIPILGVCYGSHVIAEALGGKVVKDKANEEVGTHRITLNENASRCPVFSQMPNEFDAQLGHSDHIVELPPGAVNLGSSKLSEVQAFIFPGEPIYALTFHPELNERALIERIEYYAGNYSWDEDKVAQLKSTIGPTPEAVKVFDLFMSEIVRAGRRYGS
ncbi:MAG: type 1 glutamine amidotransferase [bacterium]